MKLLNDSCFNNIQKFNLNEKTINPDNIKDENVKEYLKAMTMNIKNYKNYDVYYLDTLKRKSSLINKIFVAVKLINLSVTYFNHLNFFFSIYNIYISHSP